MIITCTAQSSCSFLRTASSSATVLENLFCTACGKQVNPWKTGMVKKHKDLKVLICRVSTVFFYQPVLNRWCWTVGWLVVGIAKHSHVWRVTGGDWDRRRWGEWELCLRLHCHHQNDPALSWAAVMGTVNFFFINCEGQTTAFEEKGEP